MTEGSGRRGFLAGAAAALAALKTGAAPLAERAAAMLPRRIYRIELDQSELSRPQRILSSKHLVGGRSGAAAEGERMMEEAVRAGRVFVGRLP